MRFGNSGEKNELSIASCSGRSFGDETGLVGEMKQVSTLGALIADVN
jgi:hypothetical protein